MLEPLRRKVVRLQRGAKAEARDAVRSARCQALWLTLARLELLHGAAIAPGRSARAFADAALARRFKKLCGHGHPAKLDSGPLHRMRIDAKKLRYIADFFGSLYKSRKVDRFADSLAALQDVLGAINDASVSRTIVNDATAAGRGSVGAESVGLVRGWIAAKEAGARAAVAAEWAGFLKRRHFW